MGYYTHTLKKMFIFLQASSQFKHNFLVFVYKMKHFPSKFWNTHISLQLASQIPFSHHTTPLTKQLACFVLYLQIKNIFLKIIYVSCSKLSKELKK